MTLREVQLRVLRLRGIDAAGDGRAEELVVRAALDGAPRRTARGVLRGSAALVEWPQESHGSLCWPIDSASLRRLQAHEPRLRIELEQDGQIVGFSHADLRDLDFQAGSSAVTTRAVLGNGSAGIRGEIEFQLTTRESVQVTHSQQEEINAKQGLTAATADGRLERPAPRLGVALTEDHVLVGSSNELDLTLYITLASAVGLSSLVPRHAGKGPHRYWLRYSIFGVLVETDRFTSLKFPKFAPIRDSFQIRSSRADIDQFLSSAPVRLSLCSEPLDKPGADYPARSRAVETLASTMIEFDSLFTAPEAFTEATSNCAFALEPRHPTELKPPAGGLPPSVSVSLELHVTGKVPRPTRDEATLTNISRAAEVQTDPDLEIASSLEPGTAQEGLVRVAVERFELALHDSEDLSSEKAHVAVGLAIEGFTDQVFSPYDFELDEYGQLEDAAVDAGVFLNIAAGSPLDRVVVHVKLSDGRICARGRVMSRADIGRVEVDLIDTIDGAKCGRAVVGLAAFGGAAHAGQAPAAAERPSLKSASGRQADSQVWDSNTTMDVSASHQLLPQLDESTVFSTGDGGADIARLDRELNARFRYRVTVDLRFIKGLEQEYNVYLQYSYPFFGTATLVQTRPPILVDRYSERIIPHGLRLFQFPSSRGELENAVQGEPLVVEMWHKDRYKSDSRVGFCALPLLKLLDARPYFQWGGQTFATFSAFQAYRARFLEEKVDQAREEVGVQTATAQRKLDRLRRQLDVPPIQVQALETELPLCAFGQDGSPGIKRLALVHCALTLENLGPVPGGGGNASSPSARANVLPPLPRGTRTAPQTPTKSSAQQVDNQAEEASQRSPISEAPPPPPPTSAPSSPSRVASPRGASPRPRTAEPGDMRPSAEAPELDDSPAVALRQAWVEFEAWKEAQTREWQAEMLNREAARMSELEQEWARREHDRALAVRTAQDEFQELEARMHRAIGDAEKRERAVARLEADLQRAADQRMADIEVLARRAREESEHQVSVHKGRAAALEEEVKRLRTALAKSEKRAAKVDEEFSAYREKVRQQPEATLHREIARLEGLHAQLHAQIEQEKDRTAAERLAKETVKAQLVQVARELDRVRKDGSQRAERQLDSLRLEFLAREERYVLDGDRQRLYDLRNELNELRSIALRQPVQPEHDFLASIPPRSPVRSLTPPSPVTHEEVVRLRKEKEDLLRTGLYSTDHPLVQQLDRHIALASQGSMQAMA